MILILIFTLFPSYSVSAANIAPGVACSKKELGRTKSADGFIYACWYTKTTKSLINNSQKWNPLPKGFSIPKDSKFTGGDIKGETSYVALTYIDKPGQSNRWQEALVSTVLQLVKGGWTCPNFYKVGVKLTGGELNKANDLKVSQSIEDQLGGACPTVYSKMSGGFKPTFIIDMVKGKRVVIVVGNYQKNFPEFTVGLNFNGAESDLLKVDCTKDSFGAFPIKMNAELSSESLNLDTGLTYSDLLSEHFGSLDSRACLAHYQYEIGVITTNPWVEIASNQFIFTPKYVTFKSEPISDWKSNFVISITEFTDWLKIRNFDQSRNSIAIGIRITNRLDPRSDFWNGQSCITTLVTSPELLTWCR
jgi:predicted HicB family RNase H-like nuclease